MEANDELDTQELQLVSTSKKNAATRARIAPDRPRVSFSARRRTCRYRIRKVVEAHCLPACLPRLAPVLPRFSGQVLPELSSPPLGIRPSGARHASIRRGLGMPVQGESRVSRHLCTGWPPLCGAAALCE